MDGARGAMGFAASLSFGGAIALWGGSIPPWARVLLYGLLVLAMVGFAARSTLAGVAANTSERNATHANGAQPPVAIRYPTSDKTR